MKTARKNAVDIFWLWLPLACMWAFMAAEMPAFHSIIARGTNVEANLAAFGLAFFLLLLIEAPVLMLLAASTALVNDKASYLHMRNFSLALGVLSSLLMILLYFTGALNWFIYDFLTLELAVADLVPLTFLFLSPIPLTVAYRRFNQGLLISKNQNTKVAISSVVRLPVGVGLSYLFLHSFDYSLSHMTAVGVSVGITVEALLTRFVAHRVIVDMMSEDHHGESSYKSILGFFIPLAASGMVTIAIHPLINLGLASWPDSLVALAVWPVMSSFVFVFASLAMANQEVLISQLKQSPNDREPLYKFSLALTTVLSLAMFFLVFTEAFNFVFGELVELPPNLLVHARDVAVILALTPIVVGWNIWQRSFLIVWRATFILSVASVIDILCVAGTLVFFFYLTEESALRAAGVAYVLGKFVSCVFLWPFMQQQDAGFRPERRRSVRSFWGVRR